MDFMKIGWKKYGYKAVKGWQIDWRTGTENQEIPRGRQTEQGMERRATAKNSISIINYVN